MVGEALGTAIVSLQQTPEDGVATLRIFCCLERFLTLLLRVLNLELPPPTYERELALRVSHCARVPYDGRGWRSTSVTSLMNLAPGQLVKLHENHNWKGCGQTRGEQMGSGSAEGRVVRYSPSQRAWELEVGGLAMLVGHWWMEAAVRGKTCHLQSPSTALREPDYPSSTSHPSRSKTNSSNGKNTGAVPFLPVINLKPEVVQVVETAPPREEQEKT